MEVSNLHTLKNILAESLVNKDIESFKKYIKESAINTEKKLVAKYSKQIKESLNA